MNFIKSSSKHAQPEIQFFYSKLVSHSNTLKSSSSNCSHCLLKNFSFVPVPWNFIACELSSFVFSLIEWEIKKKIEQSENFRVSEQRLYFYSSFNWDKLTFTFFQLFFCSRWHSNQPTIEKLFTHEMFPVFFSDFLPTNRNKDVQYTLLCRHQGHLIAVHNYNNEGEFYRRKNKWNSVLKESNNEEKLVHCGIYQKRLENSLSKLIIMNAILEYVE